MLNNNELFKRIKERLNPKLLSEKVCLIIGCGSVGSRTGEELVRAGIKKIILVDKPGERLEKHNIIRHPLGHKYLGSLKTKGLKDYFLDINPDARIEIHGIDVLKKESKLEEIVREASLIIEAVDNEPAKYSINDISLKTGTPFVGAGVFDGGIGGNVYRVSPGKTACYGCICTFLERLPFYIEKKEKNIDYSSFDENGFKSTPALNMDIASISLIQARIALMILLEDKSIMEDIDGNYVLYGNQKVEGLFDGPWYREIREIPKDPHCLICGDQFMLNKIEIDQEISGIIKNSQYWNE